MAETALIFKDTVLPLQLPDMSAAAERVLNRALELCAKKMGLDGLLAAAHQVEQGNVAARLHCCASIAKQVAASLGESDRNVVAVYSPDYDLLFQDLCSDAETRVGSTVSLLVWTQRRTAVLDLLVTGWDLALVQACRERIGSPGYASLLDVQVIEDRDLEKHFGSVRNKMTAARLAAYWMWSTNQVVDTVYDRRAA